MDVEEFESAYRRHAAAVLGFARRCVGRSDIAEDLASEAFLELFRNREKIDADRLPAWLYAVVRNRAIDYWRRLKRESEPVGHGQIPAISLDSSFDWGILDHGELNAAHRLCLTLRYIHGMSRKEIAEFSGLRENQVKGYLQYGLDLLRASLDKRREGGTR